MIIDGPRHREAYSFLIANALEGEFFDLASDRTGWTFKRVKEVLYQLFLQDTANEAFQKMIGTTNIEQFYTMARSLVPMLEHYVRDKRYTR